MKNADFSRARLGTKQNIRPVTKLQASLSQHQDLETIRNNEDL